MQHVTDARHINAAKSYDVSTTLKLLPTPSQTHVGEVDQLLDEVEKTFGLSETDLRVRAEICESFSSLINIEGLLISFNNGALSLLPLNEGFPLDNGNLLAGGSITGL